MVLGSNCALPNLWSAIPYLRNVLTMKQQTISYEKRRDQERDEEAEVRRMEREARKER